MLQSARCVLSKGNRNRYQLYGRNTHNMSVPLSFMEYRQPATYQLPSDIAQRRCHSSTISVARPASFPSAIEYQLKLGEEERTLGMPTETPQERRQYKEYKTPRARVLFHARSQH